MVMWGVGEDEMKGRHGLPTTNVYIYIPGTQLTSIFEGQPSKTRPFPIKTRAIWVPGIYIYIRISTLQDVNSIKSITVV